MSAAPANRGGARVLRDVLAALHAVVYGYGVAGARLRGADRRRALARWAHHQARRDAVAAALGAAGADVVQAAPAYDLPVPVTDASGARVLATLLEERLAAVWADAVAGSVGDLRDEAVAGLRDAAVAAAQWRGGSVPFPGLGERAT